MNVNFDAIRAAAEGYKDDMSKFLRDMIAIPSESCEHLPYKQRVTGSSPVGPIYSYADVAQLAEQLICNQQVIGSSPIIGSLDL